MSKQETMVICGLTFMPCPFDDLDTFYKEFHASREFKRMYHQDRGRFIFLIQDKDGGRFETKTALSLRKAVNAIAAGKCSVVLSRKYPEGVSGHINLWVAESDGEVYANNVDTALFGKWINQKKELVRAKLIGKRLSKLSVKEIIQFRDEMPEHFDHAKRLLNNPEYMNI